MPIINTLQINNMIANGELLFVIHCSGGLGNYIGGFFSGLDYYMKFQLHKSHKLVVISEASHPGDIVLSDLFDFSTEIYYRCCRSGDSWGAGLNIEAFNRFPHPYNHVDDTTCSKARLLWYSTCQFCITSASHIYEGIQLFSISIRKDILQRIIEFISINNIDRDTFGIHYRGTDCEVHECRQNLYEILKTNGKGMYKCYDFSIMTQPRFAYIREWLNIQSMSNGENVKCEKNYKQIFVCSDDNELEESCSKNFRILVNPKKHKVTKRPGYEHLPWRMDYHPDTKVVEAWWNAYRSNEQCIEGFIDCYILGHTSVCSFTLATTFLELAVFLDKFFPIT